MVKPKKLDIVMFTWIYLQNHIKCKRQIAKDITYSLYLKLS